MKPLLLCIGVAILAAIWILAAPCNGNRGMEWKIAKGASFFRRQLGQLENEAERIEDVPALKRLQRAYGYYVDQGCEPGCGSLRTTRHDRNRP